MKRFLSGIVALVMILAVCPVLVSAESATLEAFASSITAEAVTQNELSEFVTKDLILPTAPAGITVTWESSAPSAITNDGKVTRTDIEDKPVTLTATITDGTETIKKEINLNVVPNSTNVFYQNNFHYPELVGTSTDVTSAIGWRDDTASKVEKSIRTDENGNHYLYMDHASSNGYPQMGPNFSAKGSKITIRMDITVDATKGTSKIIDLWLGMAKGSSVEYSKPRLSTNANNITSVAGMLNLNTPPERTELYIELDMTNFTMRAKKGADGTWSASKAMPAANDTWTGELKTILFRRGSGGSPAAEVEVDNMIIYEDRDRASYADSVDVSKTVAVLDQAKMTDENFGSISKDISLTYPELQAANAANGTTVTYESSNPDVIEIVGDKGVVKRGYEAKDVTITATVSKGSFTDSLTKYKFTVIASEAATEIQNALAFSNMSGESNYAVTQDLNLNYSALSTIKSKYGAEVSIESSNPDVLEIKNGKGIITRGDEEGTATLSISAIVDGFTFSREYNIVVPAVNTYVFKSEDFNYPQLNGERISGVTGWVCETDPERFTTTIENEYGEYYIEGFLPKVDGGTRRPSFTFQNDRDVSNISVEFTATYKEDRSVNAIYEFEFWGGTTGSDLDSKNTIARIQTNGTNMYVCGHADDGTYYYGKQLFTKKRAAIGESDRYRFDFDFENQGYDFYLNGEKQNEELMPFKAGITYDSFKMFSFAAFRQSAGANILIDDFVIQARDAKFTQDYVSEAGQPLSLSFSFEDTQYNDSILMYVTSDYDEENSLRQLFKVNNPGNEINKNVIYDYRGAELVNKASGASKQLVKTPTADETAPPHFSTTYLGGNHGVSFGVRISSPAHGKTYGDIGSVWTDSEGIQWTLVRVLSEDELLFLSDGPKNSVGNWTFAKTITGDTLAYNPSYDNNFALDTSAITVASILETGVQLQPAIGNRDQKMFIYRDGVVKEYTDVDTMRDAFSINCSKIILEETYDIMDPSLIGYYLRYYRPEGGYTEPADIAEGGRPIMHYKQTITIHEDGDVIIDFDHELLEDTRNFHYYGYQYYEKADVFGGGVYRYIPGVKDLVEGDTVYEFTKPYLMTNNHFPGYTIEKADWADENFAPDRIVEYYADENDEFRMAYAAGYIPIGLAAPDVRNENVSLAFQMFNRTGMKVYPMFVNTSKHWVAGSKIKGVAFRHYDNLDQSTDKVTAYDVEYNDDVYYYIDFLEDEDNFTLDLFCKTVLRDIELVYKSADVEYAVNGSKLTASGKQSGYLCVKGKRSAEIATFAYDDATGKTGVWLNNRTSEEVTGDILIAGYNNGQFVSVCRVSDVSLKANDFTRVDTESFDGLKADEIRVFLVGSDGIAPINKKLTKAY